MPPSPIIIEPDETCDSSVIWLHGLGADGHDFEPVVAQLHPKVTSRTRYIFPNAPVQPVTINGGAEMPAWYDILDAQLERRVDAAGVERSTQTVNELIAAQCAMGIDASRIVIAGFSQGGAIALHAGLRYPQRLAGIMALSTYLPIHEGTSEQASKSNLENANSSRARIARSSCNPWQASEGSRVFLHSLGYRVQSNTYPMEHSVSAEELRDISCWLENVLAL